MQCFERLLDVLILSDVSKNEAYHVLLGDSLFYLVCIIFVHLYLNEQFLYYEDGIFLKPIDQYECLGKGQLSYLRQTCQYIYINILITYSCDQVLVYFACI